MVSTKGHSDALADGVVIKIDVRNSCVVLPLLTDNGLGRVIWWLA
jgi:hypothetical protein